MSKRSKGKGIRKKLIFITAIISLSVMGIGYAAWNDNTKINVYMETGFINPVFSIKDAQRDFEDGDFRYSISDNGKVLEITGTVYHEFNENIPIKIIDEGSIPSVYTELDIVYENEISDINENLDKRIKSLNTYDNYVQSFDVNINPDNNLQSRRFNETFSCGDDEISNLEQAIRELENEIRQYEEVGDYSFEYILNFEQGL